MREIEIKARTNGSATIIAALEARTITVSTPVKQYDRVFGLPEEVGDNINHAPWLRIRTETKNDQVTTILTLKKTVTRQLDSIEHETEVTDSQEMAHIIRHLGFVPYVELTKTRQKAIVGDIEICLDHVDGLGDFIEAEKMTDEDADYDAVVAELWEVFESFGISKDDAVTDGYDVLLKNKQG